jgi:hypothetical protein
MKSNNLTKIAISFLSIIFIVGCTFNSCTPEYLEVELQDIEKIYASTKPKDTLGQKTVLYLDHSTCVIDAVNNSKVWNAVLPNLTQYSDELVLIKGSDFERIELKNDKNIIAETLKRITKDIPWADIDKAVQEIVEGNNQAIIVSDFEAFDNKPGDLATKTFDLVPFLSRPFKTWLEKGFSTYIITESYKESYNGILVDKKRFYFIFTDDKLKAPISDNIRSQIDPLIQNSTCQIFKMTNSDISVVSPISKMSSSDLDFVAEPGSDFDFVSIANDWTDIREFVMKLDNHQQPIPGENEEAIIKNFKLNHGVNYKVEKIKVIATNITADFVAQKKNISGKDISEAFIIKPNPIQNNDLINIYLTDKIFEDGFLYTEDDKLGGNLIRLDFVIDQVSLKPYDPSIFEWNSLYKNKTAICVSLSIDNALLDINVAPSNEKRKIIRTVFIKTQNYNY